MQTIYYVGSISHAMRGKRALEKNGIRAYIRRMEADQQHGCGYGLLVTQPTASVMNVLRAAGVSAAIIKGRDGT